MAQEPAPAPPDLLLPYEVAAMFGVAVCTIRRYRTTGRIPRSQIVATPGGSYLYRGEYIRSLLAGDAR